MFPLESRLRDHAIRDVAQVEEFFAPFLADIDAVAAAVVFLAERMDVLSLGVEHDHRVHGYRGLTAMRDINQACAIDRDAVRFSPLNRIGQLAPAVDAFVFVIAFANDGILGAGFVSGIQEGWRSR